MKKKLISNFALALLAVVCFFATYMNYKHNQKLMLRDLKEKAMWMKMQDIVSTHSIKDILVATSNKDTLYLSSFAQDGTRIGVYAHRSQCSDCWKIIAQNIRNICKTYHITEPFILANGFRPIDVRVMEKEDSLGIPLYTILNDKDQFIEHLSQERKPFVFLLNPDATMSSVMFYNDAVVPIMKEYFKTLSNDSLHTGEVHMAPSHIRLGKIPHRREFKLHFTIRNNSQKRCNILKVNPSCTCIQIENMPDCIDSANTEDIHFIFTSDMLGPFVREIEIYTDFKKEPFVLSVTGNCV